MASEQGGNGRPKSTLEGSLRQGQGTGAWLMPPFSHNAGVMALEKHKVAGLMIHAYHTAEQDKWMSLGFFIQ